MAVARLRRLDGKIQFDTSALSFQLIGKGVVNVGARRGGNTTPGSALIPIAGPSGTRILAVRAPFFTAKAGTAYENGQYFANYACAASSGQVEYWAFDLSKGISRSPGGLTLRNPATGEIVYSSDYDVFRAAGRITTGSASMPVPSDRIYAAAQQDFAGRRRPENPGSYFADGVAVLDDGEPRRADTVWSYRNDGKLYGTRATVSTVEIGDVSWDDVVGQLGTGAYPPPYPPDWERPIGNVIVVDVTGL